MAIHDSTDVATQNCYAGVCSGPLGGKTKRSFDILASVSAIILLAPLLLLLSALVYLLDGSPVVIRHSRIGQGGNTFGCLKFRTMVTNGDNILRAHLQENASAQEEWTRSRKLKDDPRVTHLGHVLRKTSLDELPQLFNIVIGDMSCVGPRPIVEEEVKKYGPAYDAYTQARPGLTGSWQISGRNDITYDDRVRMDRDYVTNWSLARDLMIIVMTIPAIIKAKGVY